MAQDPKDDDSKGGNDKYTAWAILEKGGKFQKYVYSPGPLGETEIEIKVTHNGCCHSDLSMLKNDWKKTTYPLIAGHEVIGIITKLGESFINNKKYDINIGDRVGVGWQCDSCRICDYCISGNENICRKGKICTIVGHNGGFQDYLRIPGDFAHKIPKSLDSAYAAPLLCAGITVYSPLRRYINGNAGLNVGIIGIGGLGHLAIKFAKSMGVYVTAFSSSNKKKDEAINEFGCDYYQVISEINLKELQGKFDLILCTAAVPLDYKLFINLLSTNGVFCFLASFFDSINITAADLVGTQKTICGSTVGGRKLMREMLQFAALNKVYPKIEKMPFSKIQDAFERLEKNEARYRVVLVSDESQFDNDKNAETN